MKGLFSVVIVHDEPERTHIHSSCGSMTPCGWADEPAASRIGTIREVTCPDCRKIYDMLIEHAIEVGDVSKKTRRPPRR